MGTELTFSSKAYANVAKLESMLVPGLNDVYTPTVNQYFELGTQWTDGRRSFVYCQAGAVALVTGNVLQAAILGGATTTDQEDCAIATSGAIGDEFAYATIITTAQAADTFKDGYYCINEGSEAQGRGSMYPIASHGALTVASNKIPLKEPLRTATVAGTSKARLLANPFKGVIQCPATTPTGACIGGAVVSVPISYFFWAQTYGVFNALAAGAVTAGASICRAVAVAGAVAIQVTANSLITETIGYSLAAIDDTDNGPIFLTIRA